ncbi:DUF1801 domain-containing protein [Neisseria chenwenguii]|uniref:Uncharacterized protein n=1 Tax=Neisseria chenwenguii TaxID=1853278 RepID=A0A220S438_9NEIS|nr:DUF1801 domain-containing protein [Neisseria chenwenguii]ASK28207.1 hypothetical protein BG910_11115 [Neisseria chenwenguii]ROV57330.1 DUF1801 domain-containing protein [Neisseria chenwenguii]
MNQKVKSLLNDWQIGNPALYEIADSVRTRILQLADTVEEEVKYGGILFAAPEPFCGIFVYKQHVSVEFNHGAEIADPHGLLEGKGKDCRHLKLHTLEDIENKHLTDYLRLAQKAAE